MMPSFPTARWQAPTLHVVGLGVASLAPGLALSALVEWGSSTSHDEWALLLSAVIAAVGGLASWRLTYAGPRIRLATVFAIVAWSWVACIVVGALPYVLGSMFTWDRFDDAIFEAASGFTCTGASVLTDVEAHGRGIVFWRQMTQFYGGMGMVVLAVTVLPYLGVGGLSLMATESPGHDADRLAPRVSDTARRLWAVYAAITIVLTLVLWALPPVNLHDALGHAFATAATGGFSTYNASVGHFDSAVVELVVAVGMLVCALNFALHVRFLTGDRKVFLRSTDTMLFVKIVAGATIFTSAVNWRSGLASPATSLRDSFFNVVSISTSTGFGNVRPDGIGDFVLWGAFGQLTLLALMVVGGCVGSTAGGLKTYRLSVGLRHVRRELRRLRHPNGVFPVKLGAVTVPEQIVASALAFISLYALAIVLGTVAVAATGAEPMLAASGTISALSNIGPALGEAGPTGNWTVFPRPARLILTIIMIAGRLELYAVLLMIAGPLRAGRELGRHRRYQHYSTPITNGTGTR